MALAYVPWLVLLLVWAVVPFAFLGRGRAIGLAVVTVHLLLSGAVVLYGAVGEFLDAAVLAFVVFPGVITAMVRLAMEFTGPLRGPDSPPADQD